MSLEQCKAEIKLFGDGLKSEVEVHDTIIDLTLKLGSYTEGHIGKTENGHGFTITAKCGLVRDETGCYGICLREKLREAGLAGKAKITGKCLEKKP